MHKLVFVYKQCNELKGFLFCWKGCDASILLEGENTEQKARVNHGLGGLKLVNAIKDAIEKVCPGVVSCTDIIVLGARDAISLVSL